MKKLRQALLGICVLISASVVSGALARADNLVITATSQRTWKSGSDHSGIDGTPLNVKIKPGDTIEIQVPPGSGTHGFVTIDGKGTGNPKEITAPVISCGESDNNTAVLKEIECGTKSKFDVIFTGTLKLQVLQTFKGDLNFWCVQHTNVMWGTITLQP
jgi:hypothetical protein